MVANVEQDLKDLDATTAGFQREVDELRSSEQTLRVVIEEM